MDAPHKNALHKQMHCLIYLHPLILGIWTAIQRCSCCWKGTYSTHDTSIWIYSTFLCCLTLSQLHPGIPTGRPEPATVNRLHCWYKLSGALFLPDTTPTSKQDHTPIPKSGYIGNTKSPLTTLFNRKMKRDLCLLKKPWWICFLLFGWLSSVHIYHRPKLIFIS